MRTPIANRLPRLAAAAVAAALVLAQGGCGGSADGGRVAVSGRVTLDGRPLDDAVVTLLPTGGGPATSAAVASGEFRLSAAEGPAPGPHVVEVDAIRPTGKVVPNPDVPGETMEETANVIPPRYNRSSELRVEVAPEGENHFEWPLSSR